MNERGFILLAALSLVVLVGVSAGSVWFLLHADLRAIGQGRRALQALYTAEAGLLGASAAFPPRIDPLPLEDDLPPSEPGDLAVFPGPPHGFRLESWRMFQASDGERQVRLVARAEAAGGALRTLEGVLVPARQPYAPAGLMVVDGELDGLSSGLAAGGDAVILVVGDGRVAPLAAGDVAAARRLESWLPGNRLSLRGSGGVTTQRPIRIDLFLQEIDREPAAGTSWQFASFGRAARYLRGGIIKDLQGDGLLVVLGDLRLEGRVDFSGMMLVGGTLELAAVDCTFRGFVQVRDLHVESPCTFRRDLAAVWEADALQALPREVRLRAVLADGGR